jgi:large-conductance mechanosensitive channel
MADGSPAQFIDELKGAIIRRRIGQIALAVVLAEACIRYLNSLVWYLIVPLIANIVQGRTESVLFRAPRTFPWQQLTGSTLEFIVAIVFVFYVNRWIHGLSRPRSEEEILEDTNFTGTVNAEVVSESDPSPIESRK